MSQPANADTRPAAEGQLRQGGRALLLDFYTALRAWPKLITKTLYGFSASLVGSFMPFVTIKKLLTSMTMTERNSITSDLS